MKFDSNTKTLHFHFGEYLIKQGEFADAIYVIRSGRVEVLKNTKSKPFSLGMATTGHFLGEMSVLLGIESTASARAAEDVEVVVITKEACEQMFGDAPPLLLALAKGLAQRLDLTSRKFELEVDSKTPEVATRAVDLDWEG
ncbi:MAG: Crp/Fnr family transcriptional regulator [Bdellovibrio sp.]